MKNISKSTFVHFKKCSKFLWLFLNKKEEYVEDPKVQQNIANGNEVGAVAKQYFSDTVDATSLKADGSPDHQKMIDMTRLYLSQGKNTIAEASFSVDDLFCSVDLLHKVEGGFELYEVKASTGIEEKHLFDAAFQKYVLQKVGLNVVNTYILHLNGLYIRKGALELDKLFIADRVDSNPIFLQTLKDIKNDLVEIKTILSSKTEPIVSLESRCVDCQFNAYCHKGIPYPSVLDIKGTRSFGKKEKYELLHEGVISYSDVLARGQKLDRFQKNQIDAYLNNKEAIIDKDELKSFVKTIRYPIYHLDFESIMLPIPPADGTWPYEQIPTQYSLHIEYEDGRLEHKEFLGTTIDPRREIAESLCKNIPADGCTMVFNKGFEQPRLHELANQFGDLRDHLNGIADNIVDLEDPFRKGHYYHKDMGRKSSIKLVLPALCPNDPDLDYHALHLIHNGGEAMDAYPKMIAAAQPEKDEIRDALLKYCHLDTLAMIKVLGKIKEQLK